MPTNLNALIRYKTINSCLFGGRRKWSINELIDACSEALGEARGRYDLVSERTIRDDIRIMRSDILGFNAPIKQEKGLYFYADPLFSILNLRITDAGLADKIYFFLLNLRTEIKHPELENILEQLCRLTKRQYEKYIIQEGVSGEVKILEKHFSLGEKDESCIESMAQHEEFLKKKEKRLLSKVFEDITMYGKKSKLTWGEIIEMLNKITKK